MSKPGDVDIPASMRPHIHGYPGHSTTLVHETRMHGVSGSKVSRGLRGITLRFLHKINIKTEAEEEKPRIQRPQEKEELPSACPR